MNRKGHSLRRIQGGAIILSFTKEVHGSLTLL